jgi:hypothetical protein
MRSMWRCSFGVGPRLAGASSSPISVSTVTPRVRDYFRVGPAQAFEVREIHLQDTTFFALKPPFSMAKLPV